MASSDQAVEALFHQTGVVRVDSIEELFDVAQVLTHQPLPRGRRVAIVSNAGGPGVLAADACVARNLEVPELSVGLQHELVRLLAPGAGVSNPIDLIASATAEQFGQVIDRLVATTEIDAIVVIFTPPLVTRAEDVAAAIADVVDHTDVSGDRVPIVAAFLAPRDASASLGQARHPVPCFTYPETAVRALAGAVHYGSWRASPPASALELDGIDPNEARRLVANALEEPDRTVAAATGGWLTGEQAMAVLSTYGISTVPTVRVTSAEAAAEAARAIGFPVALKADGPGIVHKTERGGVRLHLHDEASVGVAFLEMGESIGPDMSGAVVQPMAASGSRPSLGSPETPSSACKCCSGSVAPPPSCWTTTWCGWFP
jgi:acyl-CoA synthetase (NDP forming)